MKKMIVLLAGVLRSSKISKGVVCIFTCLIMFLILGCATIIKDSLPDGASKGYVKFYRLKSDIGRLNLMDVHLNTKVYSIIEKNKPLEEGEIPPPTIWVDSGSLQLTKPPGNYHFKVVLGNGEKDVHVRIEEGMVTPVRIILSDVKKTSGSGYFTISFKMGIDVEKPIPFMPDKSKK
jgi:hypothetical protein